MRTPSRADIDEAHNWCDRWCERCPLADRCSIGRSAGVASSQAAMVTVAAALKRAIEMLEVECAKHGVEIDDGAPPAASAGADDLAERALSWMHAGAEWLKMAPDGEARSVVGWYHTLVPTKLHRAGSSRALGSTDDASGSAKVASLGLASVMEAVEARFPDHLSFRRPGFDP